MSEDIYDVPYEEPDSESYKMENYKNVGTKNQEAVKVEKKTNKRFLCFTAVIVSITLAIALLALGISLLQYVSIQSGDASNRALEYKLNEDIQSLEYKLNTSSEEVQSLRKTLNKTEQVVSELKTFPLITSCKEVRKSGLYLIQTNKEVSIVYCDINPRSCKTCNATDSRGWTRVANINMTDSSQQCPNGFKLVTRTEPPLRTCSRRDRFVGCLSTIFSVHGIEYSHVCGRIRGYQLGNPDGFYGYNKVDGQNNINGYFLSGISLTYGLSPRQHIWAFVNALTEGSSSIHVSQFCPCTNTNLNYNASVPPFVGEDYFCDTKFDGLWTNGVLYPDDPLWDGQGCGENSTCCEFNNPPWFCKQLPQPTTQDIEMRLCENSESDVDDSPFEIVELYIS